MFSLPSISRLQQCKVVVCTCSGAALLPRNATVQFTHVLIDEAGQALLPEALIPLSFLVQPGTTEGSADADSSTATTSVATATTAVQTSEQLKAYGAVICGDPKQLGPVVRSPQAASAGLATSLLETFINIHTQTAALFMQSGQVAATSMLVRNYRSHETLLQLPSKMFYGSALLAAADPGVVAPPQWSELSTEEGESGNDNDGEDDISATATATKEQQPVQKPPLHASLLCYGVRGQQLRESDAPSYFNPIEASTVVELIQGLINSTTAGVAPSDIGIMATYRKQVQKIRLLLRSVGLGSIRVGTLDDYQGQEERIIFISTVLSKLESLPPVLARGTGYTNSTNDSSTTLSSSAAIWGNPKRFNVAVTRAKALLVVVGHPSVLAADACWRELLRYAVSQGVYRGAGAAAMKKRYGLYSADGVFGYGGGEGGGNDGDGDEEEYEIVDGVSNDEDNDEEEDLQGAIDQLAELALLGAGDMDRLYPDHDDLDQAYEAYAEEMQWRVLL